MNVFISRNLAFVCAYCSKYNIRAACGINQSQLEIGKNLSTPHNINEVGFEGLHCPFYHVLVYACMEELTDTCKFP